MANRKYIYALILGIIVFAPSFTIILTANLANPTITLQTSTDDNISIIFDVIKKPTTSSDSPIALILHGFSGNRKMMKMMGLALADKGFISVLVDLRGHGDSGGAMGAVNNFTLDVKAVIDELNNLGVGNTSNVVFIGHSMGGGVAVNISGTYPSAAATIGIAPAISSSAVNLTNPRNLLLIISTGDAIIDNQMVINAFYSSLNGTGDSNIIYYAGGSEKMLFIDQASDHLSIIYKTAVINEVVKWATRSALGSELELGFNPDILGAMIMISLIGGVVILSSIIALVFDAFKRTGVTPGVSNIVNYKVLLKDSVAGFLAAGIVGALLSLLLSVLLLVASPLFFTDFVTALFLGNSLVVGVYALINLKSELKEFSVSQFIRKSLKTVNVRLEFTIGILTALALTFLVFITVGFNTSSTFSTSTLRLIFLPLYIFLYSVTFLFYEIYFRGLIRAKLGCGGWAAITAAIIQVTLVLSSLLLQLFIVTLILQQNISFLILGLPLIAILIVLSTVISELFYEKTGGWIGQIISNATILATMGVALSNIIYLF